MGDLRKLKFIGAGAAFCAATPALASDFSGLIYFFGAIMIVVFGFVLGLVAMVRRFSPGGVSTDVICGLILGVVFAPAALIEGFDGEAVFSWFPAWMWLWLDGYWGAYSYSVPISIAVTSGLFILILRALRLRRAVGGEAS